LIVEPKNGSWPQKAQNSHRKTNESNESNNRQIGEVVFEYYPLIFFVIYVLFVA
jgi:hypothetical protein